jgi:putative hydrolase of the HAD superfamily
VPIRNVIFDFGGVLVTWRPQEIVDAFYAEPALREAVRTQVFQHEDWLEMDRGTLDERTVIDRFAARMGRPRREMEALFEHVREAPTPIEPTVALLNELRERGYTLYGLSNMSEPIFAHLAARNDFFKLFDGIVVSAAVKLVKPEPAIYEHLRDRLPSISPSACSSTTCRATSTAPVASGSQRSSSKPRRNAAASLLDCCNACVARCGD